MCYRILTHACACTVALTVNFGNAQGWAGKNLDKQSNWKQGKICKVLYKAMAIFNAFPDDIN